MKQTKFGTYRDPGHSEIAEPGKVFTTLHLFRSAAST